VCAVVCVFGQYVDYEGHKVVRVTVNNQQEFSVLEGLLNAASFHDVWSGDSVLSLGENDIRVDDDLLKAINEAGLTNTVRIESIQALLSEERWTYLLNGSSADFFATYHRYDEIVVYLKQLTQTYPHLAQFIPSVGKTIEGRDIPAIRINATYNGAKGKKIFFQGGQHAREWIGPATVLYITTQLLEKYGKDNAVTQLVKDIEFTIVPLANPDGYEYAWTKERLWRKNRRRNSDGTYGVDLNRNWDEHWGGGGSSGVPSSDTYRGTKAFSEPESATLSKFVTELGPNVIAAIDFHSYSQLILRPYGWTNANCPDEQALKVIGDGVRLAIKAVHNKDYTNQKSIDLYVTTGTASDWWYYAGVWASYTIELRDTGKYGFVLPAAEIVPSGQEIWNSMLYFCKTVYDNYPRK